MPCYYFDLFLGTFTNRDEDGHEIESPHGAEIEAKRTVGELTRDRLLQLEGETSETIRVVVSDEQRRPVLTVTVSIEVERTGPTPSRDI